MNISSFRKKNSSKYSLIVSYITASWILKNKANNRLLSKEDAPETEAPISFMSDEDEMEFEQLSHLLNDPNADPEFIREIMMERQNMGLQPLKFNQLHSQIKYDLEEDSWMGLRLILNWRPTNLFTTETQLLFDDRHKAFNKYRLSATTIVPDRSNPEKGVVFVGRTEGGEKTMLQTHINLSGQDKLFIGANYLKPDYTQGIYEFEYGRKFDRLETTVKYASTGVYSASAVTTITKNCFFGVEAAMNPRSPITYSYSIRLKPTRKFQVASTYIGFAQFFSIDSVYKHNKNWHMYLSFQKNFNPQAAMMMGGTNSLEWSMCHDYTYNENFNFGLEINSIGIRSIITYRLNKYVSLQSNLEVSNPLDKTRRANRSFFRKFGVGFKVDSVDPQELFNTPVEEDDLSQYEIN